MIPIYPLITRVERDVEVYQVHSTFTIRERNRRDLFLLGGVMAVKGEKPALQTLALSLRTPEGPITARLCQQSVMVLIDAATRTLTGVRRGGGSAFQVEIQGYLPGSEILRDRTVKVWNVQALPTTFRGLTYHVVNVQHGIDDQFDVLLLPWEYDLLGYLSCCDRDHVEADPTRFLGEEGERWEIVGPWKVARGLNGEEG